MKNLLGTAVIACGLFVTGCHEGSASFTYVEAPPPPPPRVVVVDHGHVCGPGCGHYWDGSRYVVVTRGHRHGPGCGHYISDNRWIVGVSGPYGNAVVTGGDVHPAPVRAVRVPPPPGRPDYYVYSRSGSKWVKIRAGHRHGPGCGHIVVDGQWYLD